MSSQESYDDIFDGELEDVKDNALAQIKETAEQQERAEIKVEKSEEQLKLDKKELVRIAEKVFPELLNSLEMTEDIIVGELRVQLAEKLRGSIPVSHRDEALKWLDKEGHGHIVKRQIIIEFSKDEEKWAAKFMRDCDQRKKRLNIIVKRTVHPQTLQAWSREMLGDGEDFPMGLFGIFLQTFTKVSRAKEEETPF